MSLPIADEPPLRNPFARASAVADEEQPRIDVVAPVRGGALRRRTIWCDDRARMRALMRRFFRSTSLPADLSPDEHELLLASGWMCDPRRVPVEPRFVCRVAPVDPGAVPDVLHVNRAVRNRSRNWRGPWVAAPGPRLYVTDPWSGIEVPLWIDESTASLGEALARGDVSPGACQAAERRRLFAAGILTGTPRDAERPALAAHFARHGWVIVRQLLPQALAGAADVFFGDRIRNGFFGWDAGDRHFTAFHEPLADEIQRQLVPFVRTIVPEPVMASYTYVAGYRRGSRLRPHTDRDECEISLAINVGWKGRRHVPSAWPLVLHHRGRKREIVLERGDALLFRGIRLVHSRKGTLLPRERLTSLLLHFVHEKFGGELKPFRH